MLCYRTIHSYSSSVYAVSRVKFLKISFKTSIVAFVYRNFSSTGSMASLWLRTEQAQLSTPGARFTYKGTPCQAKAEKMQFRIIDLMRLSVLQRSGKFRSGAPRVAPGNFWERRSTLRSGESIGAPLRPSLHL